MSINDPPNRASLGPDDAGRFWGRTERPDGNGGCWLWTGARNRDGYGVVRVGGAVYLAHRLAYLTTAGPVPADMLVTHTCRARACVRPDHLALRPRHTLHGERGS